MFQHHRKLAAVAASVLAVSGGGAAVVTAASASDGPGGASAAAAPAANSEGWAPTAGATAGADSGQIEAVDGVEVKLEPDGSMAIRKADGPPPEGAQFSPTSP